MSKPVIPSASNSGAQGFPAVGKPDHRLLLKKRALTGDEALAGPAQSEEGLVLADAGDKAGAATGAAVLTGGGSATAGAATAGAAAEAAATGGWLSNVWTWVGAAASVGALALASSNRSKDSQIAPVARDIAAGGTENDASITGMARGSDGNGDALRYTVVGTAPTGVSFNSNGTFSYAPQAADAALDAGETRTVTFDYVANDGNSNSAPATITITITGANDAPVATASVATGAEDDATITGSVLGSDVDGEALTYALTAAAPAGLTFNADGTFSYVPQASDAALDAGEVNTLTFQYVANDGTEDSAPATVTITVNGANDAPVSGGGTAVSGSEDAAAIGGTVPAAVDVDGEALSYALTAAAPAGLTFNSDGTFSYAPQAADDALDVGEQNTVTFQYVANDGTVDSAAATVTITINGANDAPVNGGAASASGTEDDALISGSVPAGSDVDGEALTYALTAAAPAGLTFNSDGTFSYVPQAADDALDAGEVNTLTFQYVANDGTTDSAPATVTITITGANDAPVSGGVASASGTEDAASISGSVPAGSDVDGEALTYVLTAAAPVGLTFNSNGTFSYVPQAADNALDAGESRTVTFDYIANDGSADSAPATVTITINGANDAPVSGGAASAAGSEDDALISGSVPAASDVDGEALTYALVGAAPVGVTFNADGTFTVAPLSTDQHLDTGEVRTVTFDYVASDGTANSAPATVTVTINGANDAPVMVPVSRSLSEDAGGTVFAIPAGDTDGEALTYSVVGATPPEVSFNANGTFTFTPVAGDQGLDAGETRVVTFDVKTNDGTVDSNTVTVTVAINGANDAPVASDIGVSGSEDDASILGGLAAFDIDSEPATFALVGTAPAGLAFNTNGTFSYTPQAADNALDSGEFREVTFQYVANDGTVDSAPATVTITVNGANDAPVSGGAASVTGTEDAASISGSVPVASDVDGEALTYALTAAAPAGVTFNVDGTFSVTPLLADQGLDAGESRTITFDYVANDGTTNSAPATVTVTITGANDAPVSGGAASAAGSEDDASIAGSVPAASDVDGEVAPLTYALVGSAPAGVVFNSDGTFSVAPLAAEQGLDAGEVRTITFDYVANDGTTDSAPATVTVTINGANDAPVAVDDTGSTDEDTTLVFSAAALVANDTDLDTETLTVVAVSNAVNGTVSLAGGTVTFTPTADYSGPASFEYTVSDGDATDTGLVNITVNPVNDAPVANDATASGSEDDASIAGSVSANDVELQPLTYALTAAAPAGLTFNSDGTFSYLPQAADSALDSGETRTVTFDYVANDGTTDSAPATVTITVHGANDAPVSGGVASASGSEDDASISGSVPIASDVDGEALSYALVGAAPAGVTFNSDGTFSVAPLLADQALDDGESRTITFDYVANDGTADSAPATITVTIQGANDAPVSGGDAAASGGEDDAAIVGSVPGASDADGEAVNYALFGSAPAGLTFNSDGTFSYVPQAADQALAAATSREVTFQYVAQDGSADSAPATVIITISGVNDGPVISAPAITTPLQLGTEFRVNTTVANQQDLPSLASLADGGYVVVWRDLAQDGSGTGVYAQRYAANGSAQGGEFRVTTVTANNQDEPAVTGLADGGFLVTWMSNGQGEGYGVYAQRYAADGTAAGSEFRVNTTTASDQWTPAVAALGDGGFVVTWRSENQDGSGSGIYAQRFAANGATAGSEFLVNTETASDQMQPAVTALAGGGFVVTWLSDLQDGSGSGIYGQRHDASGAAVGGEFRVNTTTTGIQMEPAVTALSDGGFVVAWRSVGQDGSGSGVYAQRYATDGSAAGAEFRVNTVTSYDQANPAIAGLADGGFLVTWNSTLQDGSGSGIFGQRYDASGVAVGAEFRINATTAGDQFYPAVTAFADGSFVVAWQSASQDGSFYGIYAQRFNADGTLADAGSVREDIVTTASRRLVASDIDAGDVITWSITDDSTYGAMSIDASGTWTFTLDNNAVATQALAEGQVVTHTFTATATDSQGGSDTHAVTVSIIGGNDAPVVAVAPDAGNGSEDDASISGSGSGSDVDGGTTLTYSVVGTTPDGLTFNPDGTFSYVPQAADQALDSGETRSITFDYRANDGLADSNTATATITLTGANDAPVATDDDLGSTDEDTALVFSAATLLANDSDADVETFTVVAVGNAVNGTVSLVGSVVTFTPDADYNGPASFEYTVSDGTATDTGLASFVVNPVDDAPVANDSGASGSEDDALISGTASATYSGTGTLTYSLVGTAPAGLTFNPDGSYSYAPPAALQALDSGESSDITFQFTVSDGTVTSAAATVTLTVQGANDAPVAERREYLVEQTGSEFVAQLAASDIDGEILTYSIVSAPSHGTLTLLASGELHYTPTAGYYGDDSFSYRVNDGTANSAVVPVALTVVPPITYFGNDNDSSSGNSTAQTLIGRAGNDSLNGAGGNDWLFGEGGNDTLDGGAGNDVLAGGSGNDTLQGSDGNDTYLYSRGDGQDVINNLANDGLATTDVLRFGNGILPADLVFQRSGSDLLIFINGSSDRLTVQGQFTLAQQVDEFRFADGTVLTAAQVNALAGRTGPGDDFVMGQSASEVIEGQAGGDQLYGAGGNDVLAGNTGDDLLTGGEGSDTYVFNRGDGRDVINNLDVSGGSATDVLQLGAGIVAGDLSYQRSGTDLVIRIAGGSDEIRVLNHFGGSFAALDEIRLADGSVISAATIAAQLVYGTAGDDLIVLPAATNVDALAGADTVIGSAGADTIRGGTGNDRLVGGDGEDRYKFNRGDGQDIIDNTSADYATAVDVIDFGPGIVASDLLLHRYGNDLVIRIVGSTDQITVLDHFLGLWGPQTALDVISFNAGAFLSAAAIEAAIVASEGDDYYLGTDGMDTSDGLGGNDYLFGSDGSDSLSGGAGDDVVYGGLHRDTLIGGTGNDTLGGGDWGDVYVYARGDGNDTINNLRSDGATEGDTLRFTDLALGDVAFSRSGNDLRITVTATGEVITVTNHFASFDYQVDRFEFTGGVTKFAGEVAALASTPTEGNDYITGTATNDYVAALGGDDTVYGGAGVDTILGGGGNDLIYGQDNMDNLQGNAGDDTIYMGGGADTVIWHLGSGNDTIHGDTTTGTADFDRLAVWDLLPGEVSYAAGSDDRLIITIRGTEQITVREFFADPANPVLDEVYFSTPGTSVNASQIYSAVLAGTANSDYIPGLSTGDNITGQGGNDTVYGRGGADTINGGAGDDQLYGDFASNNAADASDLLTGGTGNDALQAGGGSDSYLFSSGDGIDTITNYSTDGGTTTDNIFFWGAITAANLSFRRAADDLYINYGGSNEIRVVSHFAGANYQIDNVTFESGGAAISALQIETLVRQMTTGNDYVVGTAFADNYYSAEGNDTLYGGGLNDTLDGGSGADNLYGQDGNDLLIGSLDNDALSGAAGSDTYQFYGVRPIGNDGQDIIDNYAADGITTTDTILFYSSSNVNAGNVTYYRYANDLYIRLNGTDSQIRVQGHFTSAYYQIDQIIWANGSSTPKSTIDTLYTMISTGDDSVVGSGGNDTYDALTGNDRVYGNAGNDTLTGGIGNDSLYGGAGNDSLIGGTGNDYLQGDDGADTYYFATGDGQETLNAYGSDGGSVVDVLQLGTGIVQAVTTFQRYGNNLIIRPNATDQITVNNFYSGAAYEIDEVRFNTGVVLTSTLVKALAASITTGNDNLTASSGDVLDLLAGDDQVIGAAGNEYLYGNSGNDQLSGGNGNDTLIGGSGNNTLSGDAGNDTLYNGDDGGSLNGGDGDDLLIGGAGSDNLQGGNGNDTLYGGASGTTQNMLYGGFGNDLLVNAGSGMLWGEDGNDTLQGGAGAETLFGGMGSDLLSGGAGNDWLQGDDGADTYVFNRGDGQDVIQEGSSSGFATTDVLQFGAGITLADVAFERDSYNLVIRLNGRSDQVTVSSHFYGAAYQLDEFRFADGTVLTAVQIEARLLTGTAGNDYLYGTIAADTLDGLAGNDNLRGENGNDTLTGGTGNDVLIGGNGNDLYVFRAGDGQDTITGGGGDALLLSGGLTAADITLQRYGNDLRVILNGSDDQIVLASFYLKSQQIAEIRFDSGPAITAAQITALLLSSEGDDYITGTTGNDVINAGGGGYDQVYGDAGNDTITGGAGNDWLEGNAGSDTYVVNRGDGITRINDNASDYASTTDTVAFGAGIVQADVSFERGTNSLFIRLNGTGEYVEVANYYNATSNQIERVTFADGTVLTAAQIATLLAAPTQGNDYLIGTSGNDTINGAGGSDSIVTGAGNDSLIGGDGNDVLMGEAGNDTLTGSLGNDTLYGGTGNDTVFWNSGDGNDVLWLGEADNATATDELEVNVNMGSLVFQKYNYDLYIRVDANNSILIPNYFNGTAYQLDNMVTTSAIGNPTSYIATTATMTTVYNDMVIGSSGNDNFSALGGDDVMYGYAGNDTLQGGSGNDVVYGQDGNDSLYGGDGYDTLYGGNNDDLLSDDAGGGQLYGEAGNDTLTGGSGNDFLQGGVGSDRYVIAASGGQDIIDNAANNDAAAIDTLEFASGIAAGDLRFARSGDDLVIYVAIGGGSVTVSGHFTSEANQIDQVLVNGSTITANDIATLVLQATAVADYLYGTTAGESLAGLAGDDMLFGNHGNDTLTGGSGNDLLDGGTGNDVYEFNPNDGADRIDNDSLDADITTDAISFGAGITAADLTFVNYGNDLLIRINGTSDSIRVQGHFTGNGAQIDELRFSDASTLTAAQIALLATGASAGDDYLVGTAGADAIAGLAGSDALHGQGGNDTLDGGAGYNTLFGGDGNDVLVTGDDGGQLWGDGGDDELTGGANADQLFGGAGSDTLAGGIGNDQLDGGEGSDRYDGDAGDDTFSDAEAGGGSDLYIYRYGSDGRDTISEASPADGGSEADVLEIWNAPTGGGTVTFALDGVDDLFIQVGDDPTQGILIEDFFTQDHTGLNADIEQIAIYSDAGSSLETSYTSQQVLEQLFP